MVEQVTPTEAADDIAIIGMAAQLPGARNTAQFWENLRGGVESIVPLDPEALRAAGERPDLMTRKTYVAAAAPLDGFDMFDAEFFGFSPKEAAILDPQHRKFLEVAWEAMENSGHTPDEFGGRIGVYAGCGMGSYFYFNICSNPDLVDDVGMFLLRHTGNDKDFLATRASHVFDLNGPAVNIQTACSTSLVAVHYACQALRAGECDVALAGGVTIELPQGRGYLYKENEILSPDGHCHAFDHRAQGTVFGSGAGTVMLRRLSDALADGDHVWGVIKGSAINNDGADKAGYLAPSVSGQTRAVRAALEAAGVSADTVDYVECHGTGTYIGDPIEVEALAGAFRPDTGRTVYCGIGSVKTNIGHLDTAAGVAGLIKTTLALHHGQIPASLGYEAPNPAIDFESGPFRVNDRLSDWPETGHPRRAGVNALGVGGTNAHAILEQAPPRPASEESDFPFQILCLSGRSKAALDANAAALAAHLRAHPEQPLADVAYTLRRGRRAFDRRRVLVAETHEEAASLLESPDPRRVFDHARLGDAPDIVFMFPGGGAQYAGMARDLYETEPVFAEWMDRGLTHLEGRIDFDIRALWLPEPGDEAAAEAALRKPSAQLPLIMIVEYALAQLWLSWGVRPAALVGHSMGENTAACLAGVIGFEDCIDLVLLRGRLFDSVPAGGMLSVSLPLAELEPLIGAELDIASVNAPALCAVSGPQAALDRLAATLTARGVDHARVPIDIAAHSRMLDPILAEFRGFLRGLDLKAPSLPFVSNLTGQLITDAEATDPEYWVRQLRGTVQFARCMDTLAARPARAFLEVGPGKALSSLAQMTPAVKPGQVLSSLRHPDQDIADDAYFLGVIGRLWACGIDADWDQVWGEARRLRVPLPTYAFQQARYFIEPGKAAAATPVAPMREEDRTRWGYRLGWTPRFADVDADIEAALVATAPETWLAFVDDTGFAAPALARLEKAGHKVVRVRSADCFAAHDDGSYALNAEQGRAEYDALLGDLAQRGLMPSRIAHFWLVTGAETHRPGSSFFYRNIEHGFYSLTALMQAIGDAGPDRMPHITVFTSGAAQVTDEPLPYPEKALVAGPAGVGIRELPGLTCTTVDIGAEHGGAANPLLLEELLAAPGSAFAAWRGARRFEQKVRPAPLAETAPQFAAGDTVMITGGFGGIGLSLAETLIARHGANVVLVGRGGLPDRSEWDEILRSRPARNAVARRIRAVRHLETLGGAVEPLAADVCNLEQMRAARAAAEGRFGRVGTVIHAAGAIDDGPLLTKTAPGIEAVFAPKIAGLGVMDEVFPDGDLDRLVLLSSSSVATRPAGQVDYVAANAYLNAVAQARRGGRTKVHAVGWGVWSEVGMAASAMAERQSPGPAPRMPVAGAPLVAAVSRPAQDSPVYHAHLTCRDWVLDQHRTRDGAAILPGTGYIELAAQALRAEGSDTAFELRNLHFLRPVHVADAGSVDLEVRLQPVRSGFSVEFRSEVTVDGRAATVLHAQADLHSLPDRPRPAPVDPGAIARRCKKTDSATAQGRMVSPQEAHLRFGPHWHVLQSTALGDDEGLARLALPADLRGAPVRDFILHPGLLDLATGWAMGLVPGYTGAHLWAPTSYGVVRVHRPLPEDILSHVRLRPGAPEGTARFDVRLCDRSGIVHAEIEDFRMARLKGGTLSGAAVPTARDVDFDISQSALSADEERLIHAISQGIPPAEGLDLLERSLASGASALIVSSLDLPELVRQTDLAAMPRARAEGDFERPQLESEFAAPETATQRKLAEYWKKLLGLSEVGIRDSFFDLGGHSLIAVRMFAMIRKDMGADFPISVLFEAPTIESIAERIEVETGGTAEDAAADAPPAERETFRHVVPLHSVAERPETPLFIVAGMFGNVLNLRHLSMLLGPQRPVYGLQARGLVGGDTPHATIGDAARDYIAEMRRVQPQGPYLVAGFSGGGITAYEIARQFEADGEQVALVAMLDTPLPVRPHLGAQDKALIKIHEFRRKGLAYFSEWMRNRREWKARLRNPQEGADASDGFNNTAIEAAFRSAVAQYEVRPWDGNLVLLRPQLDRHWKVSGGNFVSREREYVFEDNQWRQFAPALKVIEVPGDHDRMVLLPNVAVLADRLRREIDAAESGRARRAMTAAE